MRDEYILQSYEYLFHLGCNTPLIATESLLSGSTLYQSLRIATFEPTYLLSILHIDDMAELVFCAEAPCIAPTQDANAHFRWITATMTAFENGAPLPTTLPPDVCFTRARADLTPDQLHWFQTELNHIQPFTLQTVAPSPLPMRDGVYSRGGIRLAGHPAHLFHTRSGDADEAKHERYHAMLYKLVISAT